MYIDQTLSGDNCPYPHVGQNLIINQSKEGYKGLAELSRQKSNCKLETFSLF